MLSVLNDTVVHGVPRKDEICEEGDIISGDVTCGINGWHGDTAITFPVGKISSEAQHLLNVGKEARDLGIRSIKVGMRFCDLASIIEEFVLSQDCWVLPDFAGHGIGREIHQMFKSGILKILIILNLFLFLME